MSNEMISSSNNQSTPKELDAQALLDPIPSRSFIDRLPDIIPFLDPDSTRFADWISAYRMRDGKDTYFDYFSLPEEYRTNKHYKIKFEQLVDEVPRELFDRIYKAKDSFRGFRFNNNDYPDFYCLMGITGNGNFLVSFVGEKEEVQKWMAHFKNKYVIPKSVKVNRLIAFTQDGPDVRESRITEADSYIAHDAFYPWIEGGIDKMAEDFKNSKANVAVFYGLPGVGKSVLIRTLFFKMGYEEVASANNQRALMDPQLASWIESQPEESLVSIEDADDLARPRSNENHQMSMLLATADGVVANNRKLVISTNLESKSQIDPALIRPGRGHMVIHFRKLTPVEANKAREAIGLPRVAIEKDVTLAEALNWDNVEDIDERRVVNMGFTN